MSKFPGHYALYILFELIVQLINKEVVLFPLNIRH